MLYIIFYIVIFVVLVKDMKQRRGTPSELFIGPRHNGHSRVSFVLFININHLTGTYGCGNKCRLG